jgi:hypothetical protein
MRAVPSDDVCLLEQAMNDLGQRKAVSAPDGASSITRVSSRRTQVPIPVAHHRLARSRLGCGPTLSRWRKSEVRSRGCHVPRSNPSPSRHRDFSKEHRLQRRALTLGGLWGQATCGRDILVEHVVDRLAL